MKDSSGKALGGRAFGIEQFLAGGTVRDGQNERSSAGRHDEIKQKDEKTLNRKGSREAAAGRTVLVGGVDKGKRRDGKELMRRQWREEPNGKIKTE